MYTVYILLSQARKYHYIGISSDFPAGLLRHNGGYEKTTKPYRPFIVLFTEEYRTRKEARAREKFLKSGRGREYIRSRELVVRACLP